MTTPRFSRFLSRPKIHTNESLESYIIRLSIANNMSVQSIINFIFSHEHRSGKITAKAPTLTELNIFHARGSIEIRSEAIDRLGSMTGHDAKIFSNLIVKKSSKKHSKDISHLAYKELEIPKILFRKKFIPVCPYCLNESKYIRLSWHISLVLFCEKHNIHLLQFCPNCKVRLSYINNQDISLCPCGYDLIKYHQQKLSSNNYDNFLANLELLVTRSFISGVPESIKGFFEIVEDLNSVFIAFIFYFYFFEKKLPLPDFFSTEDCLDFYHFASDWPYMYEKHLSLLTKNGFRCLIRPSRRTAFQKIFGNLLNDLSGCEGSIIPKETYAFLDRMVRSMPSKNSVANLLLTKKEASIILGVCMEEIAKLTSKGKLSVKQKQLKSYIPIYRLEEILKLRHSQYKDKNQPVD